MENEKPNFTAMHREACEDQHGSMAMLAYLFITAAIAANGAFIYFVMLPK